jgi:hypothetical protein
VAPCLQFHGPRTLPKGSPQARTPGRQSKSSGRWSSRCDLGIIEALAKRWREKVAPADYVLNPVMRASGAEALRRYVGFPVATPACPPCPPPHQSPEEDPEGAGLDSLTLNETSGPLPISEWLLFQGFPASIPSCFSASQSWCFYWCLHSMDILGQAPDADTKRRLLQHLER